MGCCILLVGCGVQKKLYKDQKNTLFFEQQEIIARYSDLPDAPFQVQLKDIVVAPENYDAMQLFYTTKLSTQDIAVYYEQQMERLGWQLSAQSKLHDLFFYYTKPEKFCSIIIFKDSFTMYVGNT